MKYEDVRPETMQLVSEVLDLQEAQDRGRITKAQFNRKYAALNRRAQAKGITGAEIAETFNAYLEAIG